MANKKKTNILSNRQVSLAFNIPYATVCSWSVKEKDKDWRPNLLTFLASLNEKEIEIIRNRARTIDD
jgi:hypothetical protein